MNARVKQKIRQHLLQEALPHFEQFLEGREQYIRALETTIQALREDNRSFNANNLAIRSSIDELVAMQQLSNTISVATEPEQILRMLIELTQQVIPVLESNIFLLTEEQNTIIPLSASRSDRLFNEAKRQVESGIVDWVFSENKTVIIPNLDYLHAQDISRNFVIVPLVLHNRPIGIYVIHTEKPQQEFSNQDIQLLTVLANQAAAGVENWRMRQKLIEAHTQLKASQAQMIQAAKLAAIGELAANIVHEIKNPVQILMMHAEIVRQGKTIPNQEELQLNQIKRLAEITTRLMNFARNVSEEMPMTSVSVNRTVEEMVDLVKNEFLNEKVQIELRMAEKLPPITGNANYLQQVFLNFLLNARDAMPKGGTISIDTELKGFNVLVRFIDTGAGIEPQHLSKIFNPFFTTKGEGKGTGLGLSICKTIVAQHQGEIQVQSTVGKGTTFTVILPVRK
jgi:two-component system NtrC family sensor kinase